MSRIPVDAADAEGPADGPNGAARESRRTTRLDDDTIHARVEIEREITKRHLIEAISSIVVVLLYMAFTLFRERGDHVVVLDDDNDDKGPADDWQET